MSTTITTPQSTVKLSDLTVVPEDNPRGIITETDSLKDLSASIKRDGLLQPVLAVQTEDGGLKLTAGYRRVAASKLAGLKEIPVYVRELKDVEGAAFDENEQREEMSPMARAKSLARQKKALGSNKKVAERRSLTPQQVSALIGMTEMPESVQAIAMVDRNLGAGVAKELAKVGKLPGGEAVALYVANEGQENPAIYRKFAADPENLLSQVARYRDSNASDKDALGSCPVVVSVYAIDPVTLTEDAEKIAEFDRRAAAAKAILGYQARGLSEPDQWNNRANFTYQFGEVEIDALRAAGCLLEEEVDEDDEDRHFGRAWGYVFDGEVILDQIEQLITRVETEAAEVEESEKEQRRKEAEEAGLDPDAADAAAEAPGKSNHQLAKEAAAKARTDNEYIGDKLLAKSAKAPSKTRTLAAVKMIAKTAVASDDSVAAAGNRLCFKSWKEVEVKELKSKEKREKIHYLEKADAHTRLMESIDNAKTVEEVVQIVTSAFVAATFGNEDELPQSKRAYFGDKPRYVSREDLKVIDDFAKGCLPEDVEKARAKKRERGY